MTKPRLLIIDDDPGIRAFIGNVAEDMGFEVDEAESGQQYLGLYGQAHVDMIVLDLTMPKLHGIELLDFIHENHPTTKVILISGHSPAYLGRAMEIANEKGVNLVDVLNKPIKLADLEKMLKCVLPSR